MKHAFTFTPYTPRRVIEGISITKSGRIGLPRRFIATHDIQRDMRAHMYWDSARKAIAIRFSKGDDSSAYPVLFTAYSAFINAPRFFRANEVKPADYAGRHSYKQLSADSVGLANSGNVFVVELSSGIDGDE